MWKDYLKRDPDAPVFVHKEEAFKRYDETLAKIFKESTVAKQTDAVSSE